MPIDAQDWNSHFADLPLVLAGPLLRRTEPDAVTVWLALKSPCTVELTIYGTTNAGQQIRDSCSEGRRDTIAFGEFLHVVAVTAHSVGAPLQPEQLYAYDLKFSTHQAQFTLDQALASSYLPAVNLSYFAHRKPTFALPPERVEDLHLVQGSCRKPHGKGIDALPILDHLIANTAADPRHRPHQLFLTGDQIYGDDVAGSLLAIATALGDALLGWQEKLPVGPRDRIQYCFAADLPPNSRANIATKEAGFTAGLRNKRSKAANHLFSLGEYYAAYLLAWSPVLWEIPKVRSRLHKTKLASFVQTLPQVRRALANIPTYMMFDDHEVSDDWNLNRIWCFRVFGRPLGRRVVQNAILAYAVFQAWGNTPTQFAAGQAGEQLLAAAQAWSKSAGEDGKANAAIAQYTGIPPQDPKTGLPQFVQDGSVLILDRHPDVLTWHYTVTSPCHEVIVLDTRTWRGYPMDQQIGQFELHHAVAPPLLLSPTALQQQVCEPLRQSVGNDISTFLIAPTNLFGLKVIDWIHHWQLRHKKVFSTDVGDAWNINTDALAQLLTQVFSNCRSLIVLSGDIHFSSTARLSYQNLTSTADSRVDSRVLVQLTCSALKNEEVLTRLVHTRLKHWLLPEKVRHWIGWNQPARMSEQSLRRSLNSPPDWIGALEWIPRRSTQGFSNCARPVWRRLWQWLHDGPEAVGINNLAVVSFLATDAAPTVVHTLYWATSQQSTAVLYSRFDCKLTPNLELL